MTEQHPPAPAPAPAPLCPKCLGRGSYLQPVAGYVARAIATDPATKTDRETFTPYQHEVVCTCRQEGARIAEPGRCGLEPYPLHLLERYDPTDFREGAAAEHWAAVQRWVADLPATGPGFVFHGGVGNGKTRLAATLAQHARLAGVRPKLVTEPDLLAAIRATYNHEDGDEALVLAPLLSVPLLVLDDVGAAAARVSRGGEREEATWYSERMFTIIDARTRAGKPVILTSNLGTRGLVDRLGEKTASRLHALRWVLFTGHDRRAVPQTQGAQAGGGGGHGRAGR